MTEKQSKTRLEPGIIGSRVSQLEIRQTEIGREVRQLKNILDVHNNSHATLMAWIGKLVKITTNSGRIYNGTLIWIDKYNIAIERTNKTQVVIPKGNIEAICLSDEEL